MNEFVSVGIQNVVVLSLRFQCASRTQNNNNKNNNFSKERERERENERAHKRDARENERITKE